MFTIGIEYLTGYAVATDAADRDQPEWPPHPARVFMAMAAAYFETGEDPVERDALRWLEALPQQPEIFAAEADVREAVVHYVPRNDALDGSNELPMLRKRTERTYPRVRPHYPTIFLHWPDMVLGAERLGAVQRLCGKVARIGHSSSLVQMWVHDGSPQRDGLERWWVDEEHGERQMRAPTAGLLDDLRDRFRAEARTEYDRLSEPGATATGKIRTDARKRLKEEFNEVRPQPLRPEISFARPYSRVTELPATAQSVWSDSLIVRGLSPEQSQHARLDVLAAPYVARVLRDAAISRADEFGHTAIMGLISGHQTSGSPSDSPHLAYFALPFVGHQHADGHLIGVAIALPAGIDGRLRRDIVTIIDSISAKPLTLGRLGTWNLVSSLDVGYRNTLDPLTWCGSALRWGTVTPIAFDQHPKSDDRARYLEEVAQMIVQGCVNVGLPPPVSVRPSQISAHVGVPPARDFARLPRKSGGLRRHLHAVVEFAHPVRGPVLVGAGRYRGYGLLRPVGEG